MERMTPHVAIMEVHHLDPLSMDVIQLQELQLADRFPLLSQSQASQEAATAK